VRRGKRRNSHLGFMVHRSGAVDHGLLEGDPIACMAATGGAGTGNPDTTTNPVIINK